MATSKARVDAKTTGAAALGPVRIFTRKEDPQPLRRRPNTLIEKIFPTVRFRLDLAKKEDALNARIAEMETDKQQYMAELESRYASAKAAENELLKVVTELKGTLNDKEMVMKSQDLILEMRDNQLKEKEGLLKQKEKQLDEQRKRFIKTISSITHDMKSPLTTIKGFASVLKEDGVESGDPMYSSAIALENIVEDILLYNKLEFSAVVLKKENYNLTEQMGRLIEGNRKYALHEKKNIELVFDAREEMHVYGDKARLERVFGNLLSNAMKYGKRKVEISISRTASAVTISIYDDGKDMDEEVKSKIFRGEEMVTEDLVNGNGFGLTNSKRLVDMHGGRIHLESIAGKGKTFVVTLPCSQ